MVCIRLAQEADAEAIAAIYAPYVERSVVSFESVPPDREETLRRMVETTATYPWLVCERGGRVAGYAYATQHRVRAAYRWSVDTSVYIDTDCHRRGIGRGLYTSLFAILKAQGFYNAYAGITLPNAASVGLHEAVGFTAVGVYEWVGHKFGKWHDVGWWQRTLQDHIVSPAEPLPLPSILHLPEWNRLVGAGEEHVRDSHSNRNGAVDRPV